MAEIIDRIVSRDESTVTMYLTSGEKLVLKRELVYDSALRKGDELTESMLVMLQSENRKILALQQAMRYLARREHASFELKQKLRKKKYDEELIEQIIFHLKEKDLLDDYQFALKYIQERVLYKKVGEKKAAQELMAKGVSRDLIEQALSETVLDEEIEKNVKQLAEKKLRLLEKRETDTFKLKQKLVSYLLGRGYDSEIVFSTVNRMIETE